MNKPNGWQRLGAVITVLWILAIGGEYFIEINQAPVSHGWLTDIIVTETGQKISYKSLLSGMMGSYGFATIGNRFMPVSIAANKSLILIFLIVPISALWLAGFIFIWVRDGFRKATT